MVPEGWKIGKVSTLIKDLESGVSVNGEDRTFDKDEKAVLKVSAVTYGTFDPNAAKVINSQELERAKTNPIKGQIIISRSNTEALVGASAFIDKDYPNLFLPDKLWQTVPQNNSCMKWLSYLLASARTRYILSNLATGTSGSMKNITKGALLNLVVLIPPYEEQKKIAQILSTWDEAITTTEQLLANSQQQKKALMQQLLTGKKRLLNKNGVRFSGEWKKFTLGDLGETFNGLSGKTKEDFGFGKQYIPYVNIFKNSRIDLEALELVDLKESESQSLSQYGDIFFTTSSETPDEVGMSSVLLDHVDELYLNSFCFGYRLYGFESLHPEFARYFLRSEHVRSEIAVLGQGATRYNLSKKQLMRLELVLPPVNEQLKIATVLSAADQEIVLLQKKLDTFKQEKKALMQQLLTGKRRVLVS